MGYHYTADMADRPTVVMPNGGEIFRSWHTGAILWENTTNPSMDNVMIEYSDDNGGSWNFIQHSTQNDGDYDWAVPELVTSHSCLIRVSDANDPCNYDTSDDVFSLLECWWPYPACWDYASQCHGDYDGDGDVDTVDWPIFRDAFGYSYPHPVYVLNACGDHDRDGDIDTADWPEFRDNFGRVPASNCLPGDINYVFEP